MGMMSRYQKQVLLISPRVRDQGVDQIRNTQMSGSWTALARYMPGGWTCVWVERVVFLN